MPTARRPKRSSSSSIAPGPSGKANGLRLTPHRRRQIEGDLAARSDWRGAERTAASARDLRLHARREVAGGAFRRSGERAGLIRRFPQQQR